VVSRSISSADDDQQRVARKARSSPPDEEAEEDALEVVRELQATVTDFEARNNEQEDVEYDYYGRRDGAISRRGPSPVGALACPAFQRWAPARPAPAPHRSYESPFSASCCVPGGEPSLIASSRNRSMEIA